MASLTGRNLDYDMMRGLKHRAVRNGRSAEAEHEEILKKALVNDMPRPQHGEAFSWEERAAKLRRQTAGRPTTPSEILIREDRDSR